MRKAKGKAILAPPPPPPLLINPPLLQSYLSRLSIERLSLPKSDASSSTTSQSQHAPLSLAPSSSLLPNPPFSLFTLRLIMPKAFQKRFACFDSHPRSRAPAPAPIPPFPKKTISDPWTKVLPKKVRSSLNNISNSNFRSFFASEHRSLLKGKKCFNCLFGGHTKSDCCLPKRCLVCRRFGHLAKSCSFLSNGDLPPPNPSSNNISDQIPSHTPPNTIYTPSLDTNLQLIPAPSPSSNMAVPHNWQYTPMDSAEPFYNFRAQSLSVFFFPRPGIHPDNDFLHRSAVVTFRSNGPTPFNLSYRLALRLSGQFGGATHQYHLHSVHQDTGDLILICPNQRIRDEICALTFINMHNIQFRFVRWSKASGTAFEIPVYRTRVRLTGQPLHLWNHRDLCTLVSGFGYPVAIAPYFVNGVFSFLHLLVKGKHPAEIPHELEASEDPRATKVRVVVEGYEQIGYHGEPPFIGPGRPWIPPPPPPPPSSDSDNSSTADSGGYPPSANSVFMADTDLSPPVQQSNGDDTQISIHAVLHPAPLVVSNSNFFGPLALPPLTASASPLEFGPNPGTNIPPMQLSNWIPSPPIVLPPTSVPLTLTLDQSNPTSLGLTSDHCLQIDQIQNFFGPPLLGPLPDSQASQQAFNYSDAPPGFESQNPTEPLLLLPPPPTSPVNLSSSSAQPRRSPRLQTKLSGPYTSSIQKAQKVQYASMDPSKERKKHFRAQRLAEDFLTDVAPPTMEQVELVINAAGIELTEAIKTLLNDAGVF